MNNKKLYIFIVILLLFSCQEKEIVIDSEEKRMFLASENIGYYRDGKGVLLYDQGKHQLVVNNKRHLFRLQSDRQEEYINVKLETMPRRQGRYVIISFTTFFMEEDISYLHIFECSRMLNDRMWFWNADTKEGIITPILDE